MVKLVGRRTGVVVDTDDLAQDGAFDDLDAFWAAAAQPAWDLSLIHISEPTRPY